MAKKTTGQWGIYFPSHYKDGGLRNEIKPVPFKALRKMLALGVKPIRDLEQLAVLSREMSYGILSGFGVIPQATEFGVHVEYPQSFIGERDPIFTLEIIPPEMLGVRGRIISCINDARALDPKDLPDSRGFVMKKAA